MEQTNQGFGIRFLSFDVVDVTQEDDVVKTFNFERFQRTAVVNVTLSQFDFDVFELAI